MTEDHRLIKSAKSARDGNVSEATIPDEVVSEAKEVWADAWAERWRDDNRDPEPALYIARAILAERFACAKIAETSENGFQTAGDERRAQDIADRIRRR